MKFGIIWAQEKLGVIRECVISNRTADQDGPFNPDLHYSTNLQRLRVMCKACSSNCGELEVFIFPRLFFLGCFFFND